jgi:hypothetical protein
MRDFHGVHGTPDGGAIDEITESPASAGLL